MSEEILQTLGRVDGRVFDARRLRPADVTQLRSIGGLECPVCRSEATLVITEEGPMVAHRATHEPEDAERRTAKRQLAAQLERLFPGAVISLDVDLGDPELGFADIAIVRPNGARIAITYRSGEMRARAAGERTERLAAGRIRHLWLLDARRLNKTARRGAETQVRPVTLKALETSLVAADEPLIYADAGKALAHWVTPPAAALELTRLGLGRIGRLDCLIRRYRFSQLRLREGRWWADTSFDGPPPPAPPLPERLQNKLEELRGAA